MSKRGSTKSEPVLAASAGASASVVKKDEAPQKRNKVMSKTAMKRKRKKEASVGGSWGSGGSRVVRLNVGGVLYYTTEETLTQQGRLHNANEHAAHENYFSSLLSGRIATLKDESGAHPYFA